MSEKPEQEDKPKADVKSPGPARKPNAKPAGRRGLGWLVIIVLLAAIGAGGWFGWQWLQKAESYYTGMLDQQQREIRSLRDELRALQETTVDVGSFTESQDAVATSQDALRDRVDALATSVEQLRDAAQGGRRDLLRAEVEFLLRIAADELYLTGDVDSAIYALQAADDRLRALEAPQLNPVREAIASHLTALGAVTVPDTNGMALKLGSLMRSVDDLPLSQSAHARATEEEAAQQPAEGWWARFKAGTQRLFRKLVNIKQAEPPPPLLTPEQHFFLYRNVELQFAAARAALLQGDATAYRRSLETAREWLNRYFDTDDAQVKGVLADINGLLSVSLQPDLPDISGALQTLRRIMGNEVRGR